MGAFWTILFFMRKDLRRAMLWSGVFYIVFLSIGFVGYRLVFDDPVRSITPGYWAPDTLFDLGQKTHGYAIEDALFMFFAGGTAAALYEFCFRQKLGEGRVKKRSKKIMILVGVSAAGIFHSLFYLNDIYLLITFNLFGALFIMWQRRDLIRASLMAGLLYLGVYGGQFLIFNMLFPNFIDTYYNLQATSNLMPLGIPLEEYLYAFTFGMIWGPIYKYAKGATDKKITKGSNNKSIHSKKNVERVKEGE